MKFHRFKYKIINSTNDTAIKKIKKGYLKGVITSDNQKRQEVSMEKSGFVIKIYL